MQVCRQGACAEVMFDKHPSLTNLKGFLAETEQEISLHLLLTSYLYSS